MAPCVGITCVHLEIVWRNIPPKSGTILYYISEMAVCRLNWQYSNTAYYRVLLYCMTTSGFCGVWHCVAKPLMLFYQKLFFVMRVSSILVWYFCSWLHQWLLIIFLNLVLYLKFLPSYQKIMLIWNFSLVLHLETILWIYETLGRLMYSLKTQKIEMSSCLF